MSAYVEPQDSLHFGATQKCNLPPEVRVPIYGWYLPFAQVRTGSSLSFAIISAAQDRPSVRLRINMK